MQEQNNQATLGGGCFWCMEAAYQRLIGVTKVVSGYSGGKSSKIVDDHAEVVQITYDSNIITYQNLLQVFFTIHDPTTLNKQGYDVGTMYRSIILYHNDQQKNNAIQMIEDLNKQKIFQNPIVTIVQQYQKFHLAEDGHQNFYNNNQKYPYCTFTIDPKLEKIKKGFAHLIKKIE